MSSARNSTLPRANARRVRPRRAGLIWGVAVALVVAVLLLTEQVALLYVVATLSVSALLIVVAFASFGESRGATEPAPFDDAAAIADRNLSAERTAAPSAASNATAARQTSRRR